MASSILIQKINCVYISGASPVVGTLYLFNQYLCFYSSLNSEKLFGPETVIKLRYENLGHIMMEENGINKCLTIMINGVVNQKFMKFQKSGNTKQMY